MDAQFRSWHSNSRHPTSRNRPVFCLLQAPRRTRHRASARRSSDADARSRVELDRHDREAYLRQHALALDRFSHHRWRETRPEPRHRIRRAAANARGNDGAWEAGWKSVFELSRRLPMPISAGRSRFATSLIPCCRRSTATSRTCPITWARSYSSQSILRAATGRRSRFRAENPATLTACVASGKISQR